MAIYSVKENIPQTSGRYGACCRVKIDNLSFFLQSPLTKIFNERDFKIVS